MHLLPSDQEHGAAAGLLSVSRGVGIIAGPLLAGLAVEVMRDVGALTFDDTQGYSAIFAVTAALLVASTPALRRIGMPSTARP